MFEKFLRKNSAILISLFVFAVYLTTLAKSTVSLDNGELAATSYLLGIPHPTGYPLFTIIGFLFSHIPLSMRVIHQLNLLSTIYASIGVFFTIKLIRIIVNELENSLSTEKFQLNKLSEFSITLISIIGGLVFAFSKTFWFQSTNYEVYTLNIALMSATIFYSIRAYLKERVNQDEINFLRNKWLVVFILFGLILSHHLLGVFVIIPIMYLYFKNFQRTRIITFLKFILISGLIAILFYSYIPIRSSMNSLVGFGRPANILETIDHITGKIYRPMMMSSDASAIYNLITFVSSLSIHFDKYDFDNSEFNLMILLIVPGLFFAFVYRQKIFNLFLILLAIYLIVPLFYAILDIDAYFLPAYYIIVIFISTGIYFLMKVISRDLYKKIFVVFLILLVSVQFYFNYNRVDQSEVYLEEDYFNSIVKHIEDNSVLINFSSWLHSLSMYYQLVEKVKPNVVFITYPVAGERWYAEQVNRLFAKEKLIDVDSNRIKFNLSGRQVYLTYEMIKKVQAGEMKFGDDIQFIPFGLTYKLSKKGEYVEQLFDLYELRFMKVKLYTNQELKDILMTMMINRIYYELDFAKYDKAEELTKLFVAKFGVENLPINLLQYYNK